MEIVSEEIISVVGLSEGIKKKLCLLEDDRTNKNSFLFCHLTSKVVKGLDFLKLVIQLEKEFWFGQSILGLISVIQIIHFLELIE